MLALLCGCGGAAPVEVALSDVRIRVEPASGRIAILKPDGSAILDGQPGGVEWRDANVTWAEEYGSFQPTEDGLLVWTNASHFSNAHALSDGVSFDLAGGSGSVRRIADGTVAITLAAPSGNRTSAAFRCAPDERFLGFGAMPMDVEHRGSTVPLWVSEGGIGRVDTDDQPGAWFLTGTRHQSYFPVPFFVSSHAYGVRAETQFKSVFDMCNESADTIRIEAWEPTLTLHVYFGDTPADVLQRHSDEIGRPPVPPRFAFAPWNDAIFGSASVRHVAAVLRANKIPSSVIWTEDWAGGEMGSTGYRLTYDWSVDRTLYPDAELLAAQLHAQGFKWLAYFNTFAETTGDHYQPEFLIAHADGTPYLMDSVRFGKKTSLVDLGNLGAQEWMAASMVQALDVGFDGWMADYGEWLPVDGAPPPSEHQVYPVLWQHLNQRVLEQRDGDHLVFVRSGYSGSQPIAHQIVWGGDQNTDFDVGDGLPSVIPLALGLGVAGLPFFGSDIGGYTTVPGAATGTKELFFRWSVLGALSPVMRTHHGSAAPMNWQFDSDAETLAHYTRWARAHMQLFPYLRMAATEASATGMPMMRALGLAFPADARAWTTADEYLLGPSLLVAPVTASGVDHRSVYFPDGNWFPIFTLGNLPAMAGGDADVSAPLGELPLFARGGSIVVLLPDGVQSLNDEPSADREVWLFGGGAADVSEPDGARYQLADVTPGAGDALTWNGAPIAGATLDSGARIASATVQGNGALAVASGVVLTLSNGAPSRTIKIRWRW
jgi:alpha-D-xyloside xylohydrolase/alpha-glucosidase